MPRRSDSARRWPPWWLRAPGLAPVAAAGGHVRRSSPELAPTAACRSLQDLASAAVRRSSWEGLRPRVPPARARLRARSA